MPPEVRGAAELALDRKALDVKVLDLRELSSTTDFFVIATGRSDVHVKAIAEHVVVSGKRRGAPPAYVEGMDGGRWVLLDYIDHVVHVFQASVREFYRLEELWGDAPLTEMAETAAGEGPAGEGPAP